jgi:hypothetical protein
LEAEVQQSESIGMSYSQFSFHQQGADWFDVDPHKRTAEVWQQCRALWSWLMRFKLTPITKWQTGSEDVCMRSELFTNFQNIFWLDGAIQSLIIGNSERQYFFPRLLEIIGFSFIYETSECWTLLVNYKLCTQLHKCDFELLKALLCLLLLRRLIILSRVWSVIIDGFWIDNRVCWISWHSAWVHFIVHYCTYISVHSHVFFAVACYRLPTADVPLTAGFRTDPCLSSQILRATAHNAWTA